MSADAVGARIAVLGSANMDLVVRVQRPPLPGETISGSAFATIPGGKGLNQAVAAARAGGNVQFLGAVGGDAFGDRLLALLARERIDAAAVRRLDSPTGTAHITVDEAGENSIIVVAGANGRVGPDILRTADTAGVGWLMTQLELPLETVADALEWAAAAGVRTVLTPAPARPLHDDLLRRVALLVPNALEACQLGETDDPLEAACRLSQLCTDVVVTLGSAGSVWASGGAIRHREQAVPAAAIDTTAAGDTYVGVLVTMLAEGGEIDAAMRFASVAASLGVARAGATDSMPTRDEIEAALRLL